MKRIRRLLYILMICNIAFLSIQPTFIKGEELMTTDDMLDAYQEGGAGWDTTSDNGNPENLEDEDVQNIMDIGSQILGQNGSSQPTPGVNNVDGNIFCNPDPESDNHICAPEQTCQKRFRKVLPSGPGSPNPFLTTNSKSLGSDDFNMQPEEVQSGVDISTHSVDAQTGSVTFSWEFAESTAYKWYLSTEKNNRSNAIAFFEQPLSQSDIEAEDFEGFDNPNLSYDAGTFTLENLDPDTTYYSHVAKEGEDVSQNEAIEQNLQTVEDMSILDYLDINDPANSLRISNDPEIGIEFFKDDELEQTNELIEYWEDWIDMSEEEREQTDASEKLPQVENSDKVTFEPTDQNIEEAENVILPSLYRHAELLETGDFPNGIKSSWNIMGFRTNTEENGSQQNSSQQKNKVKPKYQCVSPPSIPGMEGSDYYAGRTEEGYNQSSPNLNDPGVPVNVINQGPVPVDLFNYPNPINTNVVSPNPMPVRVIDDLPMYHQTRIDEAQAAIQQARTTQQTANSVMKTVNEENLAVRNPEEIRQENVESTIEDPTTGIRATARAEHGDNPEMDFTELDTMFDNFKSKKDPTELTPETTNSACGEGVTREEASEVGISCALSFLEPQNRPDGQKFEIWQKANANFEIAEQHTDQMIEDGYYPATEDGDRNPFTAQIKTPASTISETVDNTVTASLNQAIQDSGVAGDACWGRLPGQAIDGTLNPVLRDGILKDLENLDPEGDETEEGLDEADKFIKNDLAQSLVAGANCEVSRTVDNILAGTPLSFDLESGVVGFNENINLWGLGIDVDGGFNAREGTLEGFGINNDLLGEVSVDENGNIVTDESQTIEDVSNLIDQLGGQDEQPQAEEFLESDEFEFGGENELDL